MSLNLRDAPKCSRCGWKRSPLRTQHIAGRCCPGCFATRELGLALLTIELGLDITKERLLGWRRGLGAAGAAQRRRVKAQRRRAKIRKIAPATGARLAAPTAAPRPPRAPGKSSTIPTPHAVYAEPPVRGGVNPGLGAAVCAVCNGSWTPTGPVVWAVTTDSTPIHAGRCLRRYVTAKRLEGRQWWRIIDLGLDWLSHLGVAGARAALLAGATEGIAGATEARKAAPIEDWS